MTRYEIGDKNIGEKRGKDAHSGDKTATLMRSDCTASKISLISSLSRISTANVSHKPSRRYYKNRNGSGGLETKLEKLSKRRNQTQNAVHEMCLRG